MTTPWPPKRLESKDEVIDWLNDFATREWVFRGHAKAYDSTKATIDRLDVTCLSTRAEKLAAERDSLAAIRQIDRSAFQVGEALALPDDPATSMLLRHYGIPCRAVDWSRSPFVAAFFACEKHAECDAQIWSFDRVAFEQIGKTQWMRFPENTKDGSGNPDQFDGKLTMYTEQEPIHWITLVHYLNGFPRQDVQSGCYSMTPGFGKDHLDAFAELLPPEYRLCCEIAAEAKAGVRAWLAASKGLTKKAVYLDPHGLEGILEPIRKDFFPRRCER
jgi:FRG domain